MSNENNNMTPGAEDYDADSIKVLRGLDAERRAALFEEVVALSVQCWMTGTDAELFAPLAGRAQVLRVADGSIAAA